LKDLSESRVLLVDDSEANVDVLVQALRDEYKLSVAMDGEAALRAIEKNPPDLVLLDIMMPGIDGYEVCRRIRAKEAWRELPVMFLSSLEDARDKARGFEAGGNDYVTKPFEPLEVRARVGSLLRSKAYADAVRETLARDLRIAREIQMGILPADLPGTTKGTGLDVAALIEPARAVGGDLYEVLRPAEDRVFVALGDVSGKGIPAALFMAVTMTLMRTMARQHDDPAVILRRVNDELVEQNPRLMFVTLQCAVFDLRRRHVTVASAGHHPALVLSPGKPPRQAFPATGRVVGIMPDNPVTSESMDLTPGDTLLFFSDGVNEAFDEQQELLGDARVIAHLAKQPGTTAAETVQSVLARVKAHAGRAKQSDDISILASRWSPEGVRS
jgi:sigma-B regulation protein RsbU (phosphoserine phosphatase)